MKYSSILLAIFVATPAIFVANPAFSQQLEVKSPDGRTSVCFSKPRKELTYAITSDGKEIISHFQRQKI